MWPKRSDTAELTCSGFPCSPAPMFVLHPPLCFFFHLPSDTDYLKYLFPQFVKSNLYHLCYTSIGQRISICNYWNGETQAETLVEKFFLDCDQEVFSCSSLSSSSSDPHHRDLYVNSSDYLALLNSERANPNSTGQLHN